MQIKIKNEQSDLMEQRLNQFKTRIQEIADTLSDWSPYEEALDELVQVADRTLGYFSGAHGRYRQAKQLCISDRVDGVITSASIYENTGIVLGMLQKGFKERKNKTGVKSDL